MMLYYLMGNGQVERFNQMFFKMMGIFDDEQKKDWKIYVLLLVYVYNVMKYEIIGFFLYYFMFGWNL